MADFALPHDHGRHKHDEALHRELMNTERFSAVADVFKQLSDPVRVRIFWLFESPGRMCYQHCSDDGYVESGSFAPFEVAFRQWAYHEPPRWQGSLL